MRIKLLSFKPSVYNKLLSGIKIYEHRKVFPDEPIKAYLYVSYPVCAITGIIYLGKRHSIKEWKTVYSYDEAAVKRIDNYLLTQNYAMEIVKFEETSSIPLTILRTDLKKFVVPQMYYYIDEDSELLKYLQDNIKTTGITITHKFDNITSDDICVN